MTDAKFLPNAPLSTSSVTICAALSTAGSFHCDQSPPWSFWNRPGPASRSTRYSIHMSSVHEEVLLPASAKGVMFLFLNVVTRLVSSRHVVGGCAPAAA